MFDTMTPDTTPPQREFIPAPPGWVARFAWLDAKTGAVKVDFLPVVGWAVDGDRFERVPLIWEPLENELLTRDEFDIDNGCIDAVFFDPSKVPGEPELDADFIRSVAQIKQRPTAAADA